MLLFRRAIFIVTRIGIFEDCQDTTCSRHRTMGFKFKTGERKTVTRTKLTSLHERIEKDSKTLLGNSFTIVNLRMIELDPGSFKYQYYVQYTSGEKAGTYQFCVLKVVQDDEGQTLPLQMWGPFAKVIGMTAEAFVNLEEDQQKVAIESIENEARYNIEVKFTNDGFKLTNLELAQGKNNDEGDTVSCPTKKAKKATAGKT